MKKKRTLFVALVLSLVGVLGTAFAASAGTSDPGYKWYNGDHYLQCYEFKNLYGTGWRSTDAISDVYYQGLNKCHNDRDFVTQVKETNVNTYMAAFRGAYMGSGDVLTNIAWIRKVAANNASYIYLPQSYEAMSLHARTDDRLVGTYRSYGIWSPDTY